MSHPLVKLFKKDEGPNKFQFDKKDKVMKALLEKAKEDLATQRTKAKLGTNANDLKLKDHVQERRMDALKTARAKLESQPKKKARVVKVT